MSELQLVGAVEIAALAPVLIGGVLASAGALLVQRTRDRKGAKAAARLVYGELRDNRRQLHALRGVLISQYALLFEHGLPTATRRQIAEAGFEQIDDVEYYLAHLDDFAIAATEADREDVLEQAHAGFRDRLRQHGILPTETLRRNAWLSHSPALVAQLEPVALGVVSRAYELVDRVRVTTEVGEPVLLEGEFFQDEVLPVLAGALEQLAPVAELDREALEADADAAEAVGRAAMQDIGPPEAEDERPGGD